MTLTPTPAVRGALLPDPKAVDRAIGARLKALRILAGLSQENVASQLGLSFQQLQKYEKGVNRTSAGRLAQLAVIYNTSLADLFQSAADLAGLPPSQGRAADTAALRLQAAVAAIQSPQVRNRLVSLAETLAAAQPDIVRIQGGPLPPLDLALIDTANPRDKAA